MPQVDTVEQPVQLVDRQFDGLVADIGLGLEALGLQALELQAEAIALPVEDHDLVTGAVDEHEQHWVKHFHLDVQCDQRGQTVDGFTEVDGLWIEVDLLHLGVGTHHGMNSGENASTASDDQQAMGRWGLWSAYCETRGDPVLSTDSLHSHAGHRHNVWLRLCIGSLIDERTHLARRNPCGLNGG